MIAFQKIYPQAKIITLDQNYRSTQTILNTSFDLIQKNHLKIEDVIKSAKPKLISQKKYHGSKLQTICLPSETLETFWVANKAKLLIKQGVKPQSIAVLVRHNSDIPALANMFAKINIAVNIVGGGDILKDPDLNKFLTLLKVINTTKDNLEDLDLFTLFHYSYFNFDSLDILKLARSASQKRISIIDLIQSSKLTSLGLKHPKKFIKFLSLLTHWQQLDSQLTFPQFFETLLQESGYLDWIMIQSDVVEKLNRLNSLFSQIKSLSFTDHQLNLNSFLKSLELMKLNHLKITETDLNIKSNTVTLTTAHKAKGKEWSYVFIYRCIDKKWGNNQTRKLIKLPLGILKNTDLSKKEKNEDERRLFYVSLTRAKHRLYLSYADNYSSGGYIREAVPTMFLSQLPRKNLNSLIFKTIKSKPQAILRQILSPTPPVKPSFKEEDFLLTLIKDFKLSPTALNTFLACPYKFKLNNLIRVPRAKQSYLSYGTAIHKALEKFYRQFLENDQYPSKNFLLTSFATAIRKEVLTKSDFKIRLQQGKETLSTYYDYYQNNFTKPLFIEKFFGGVQSRPFLDDIPLSGKIDRIDWLDQQKKTVKVIDYKTGQPKTRNQILGFTKDSQGDLIRQLTFYKLLTQLDHNFQLTVKQAELDFVEPVKNSTKFRKESFIITEDLIIKLRQEIKASMKSIRALKFNHTVNHHHCDRCEFKSHCWPNGLPLTSSK